MVGTNTAWSGKKPFRGGDIVMLVEAADSGIAWTEPRDFPLDDLGAAQANPPQVIPSGFHSWEDSFLFIDYRSPTASATTFRGIYDLPVGSLSSEELRKVLQVDGFRQEQILGLDASREHRRHLNWPNIAALAVWLVSVGTLLTHAVRSRKRLSVPVTPHSG